jgi:UDP-2-acetamido-3-amino-2,3-dideoxy-glucuronate N-acetyltransferase
LRVQAKESAVIHPTADISPNVIIDETTQVWDQVRIREGAVLGAECIVGRGAYIDAGVRIGDRVKIQNDALLYHGCTVESGVFIGPGAILTNDRFPRATTADGSLATSDDWEVSEIRLGRGCSIGAGAIVVAGHDVGPFALVAAGAVVTREVPAHGLAAGNPARVVGWVCTCGQRLRDADGSVVAAKHDGLAVCPRDLTRYVIREHICQEEVQG